MSLSRQGHIYAVLEGSSIGFESLRPHVARCARWVGVPTRCRKWLPSHAPGIVVRTWATSNSNRPAIPVDGGPTHPKVRRTTGQQAAVDNQEITKIATPRR